MILTTVFLATAIFAVVNGACTETMSPMTTTTPPATTMMAADILYDAKLKKAMIVRADGCYEYNLNHQDYLDSQNDATRPALEVKMLSALASATSIQETGHHYMDHMTQEIRTACAPVPVYSFDIAR